MRSPTKQDGTVRDAKRTSSSGLASAARSGKAKGETKPEGAVVTSMVDALEDILKWERASERAIRVAADQRPDASATELAPSN